jgi:vitamin B12 transporter
MKKRFFVLAALIFSSQLHAQQDTTIHSLDEVILSSHKYPKKQSETGKVTIIINRQQIEKNSGKTLGELLNTVAGTTITGANNVLGTNQTVSIRGASAGNVLILLDGIPVNDPSVITNYFDLNFINPDQIERIEILKGGQSTLYGSDAVAGVINIISRKAEEGKLNMTGNFSGGSYSTLKQSLGLGGRSKQTSYVINYTHVNSMGFSAAHDRNRSGGFDKDGFNQHVLSGNLGFKIAKRITVSLFSNYSRYKAELDAAAFTDDRDFKVNSNNVQAGSGLVYTHNKGVLRLNYSFNRSERDYLDDSMHQSNPFQVYSKSNYVGRTHFIEIYNSQKWEYLELLTGIDSRFHGTEQSFFSTGLFGPYTAPGLNVNMKQLSPYASLVYNNKKGFTGEAGGRWNRHSEYGSNFSYTVNPSLLINKHTKIFFNFYSAYKVPTLYQLFDQFAGNRGLEPEKGMIAETGADLLPFHSLRCRITGFYRKTRDAILYTFNPATFESKYRNVSEQRNYGIELEGDYTKGMVSIAANYTYTDGRTNSRFDGTGSPIGKDTSYYNLYRIPKHAVNLAIGLQASKNIYFSTQMRSVSKREEFIFGSPPETLRAYTTIDLYSEYKFEKLVRIWLDLKNITNKEYFDILGYNSRRFNFVLGVSFGL